MLRLVTFFGVTSVFLATVFTLHHVLPNADVFALPAEGQVLSLDGYTRPQIATMKLRHAESVPPYDIGLFGNSRSLQAGVKEIGVGGCRFFNFSIHASSYRNSLVMLETLAKQISAPKLALVSVDNFVIQLFRNPADLPLGVRWKASLRDIVSGFTTPGLGISERIKMLWRPIYTEGEMFAEAFQFIRLRSLFENLLYSFDAKKALQSGQTGYLTDGTRVQPPPQGKPIDSIERSPGFRVSLGYLALDLDRFAALKKHGIDVVLYESLLEPQSADHYAATPDAAAAQTRAAFLSGCKERGLTCYSAPQRFPEPLRPWYDSTHPHPESLGLYVHHLIEAAAPRCLDK